MPKKNKSTPEEATGIEMQPTRPCQQNTPNGDNDDWEFVGLPDDTQDSAPAAAAGSGAAQTPAANWQADLEQSSYSYMGTLYSAMSSAYTTLSSARNDLVNGSEYIGPLTNLHLASSTSAMPSIASFAVRGMFEAAYYATQQISSAASQLPGLAGATTAPSAARPNTPAFAPPASGPASLHLNETPDAESSDEAQAKILRASLLEIFPDQDMIDCDEDQTLDASEAAKGAGDLDESTPSIPPQHSAPAQGSGAQEQRAGQAFRVGFTDQNEVRIFTQELHEFQTDDDSADEEQDTDESEDTEDSEEHHESESASDSDNAEDPDGPAGSGGSAGSDDSKDSDDADSADDANTRDNDDAPSSPEQTPPGNQLALQDVTIPVAFLLAAPDLDSEDDYAMPSAAIGNSFLPEEGPGISTAAMAVGLAITAYLIGTEMPDWSGSDCHAIGQPLNLLAGLMV